MSRMKYNYYLKDPQGVRYITDNLNEFSKNFELTLSSMNKLCSNKQNQYKGWICIERIKLVK